MDARYPIGKMEMPKEITPARRQEAIESIARTPKNLREAVRGLSEAQLDTAYRDGGWTIRQVVHHVPDSHLNAYIRLRLALTEDKPMIKPYAEADWAELVDAKSGPIEVSQRLLDALHERWDQLWRSMKTGAIFAQAGASRSTESEASIGCCLFMNGTGSITRAYHGAAETEGLVEQI